MVMYDETNVTDEAKKLIYDKIVFKAVMTSDYNKIT